MRPYQLFAAMSQEQAERFFERVRAASPAIYLSALQAAAAAVKARPQFYAKRPFASQVKAVRGTLARIGSDSAAEEVLAVYFLEARKELLVEWLGLLGLEHEEGMLKEDSPAQPEESALHEAVKRFCTADGDEDRELLLHAFSAQSAIDWPALDALLATS